MNQWAVLFVFQITYLRHVAVEAVSSVVGSTVTLECPLIPSQPNDVTWKKLPNQLLSYGSSILQDLQPEELRLRLSITPDNGKKHLAISDLKKTDEGQYQCFINTNNGPLITLTAIDGPTGVGFDNKEDNKLQGTEGQDLRFRCTAVGGDPKPNVIIQIGTNGPKYTGTNGVVEHTIPGIDRSYDETPVSCRTDYPGVVYQPLTDIANIYLYLKPLPPTFSPDPISTEDTKALVLTCSSTGSRPAPTERIWLLGDSSTDITSNATLSSTQDSSKADTYIATSTLTYTVQKQYNGKSITCGFKNMATGNTFIQSSKQIDVNYAPTITVSNKTLDLTQTSLEIHCHLDGNPPTYTYQPWDHRSKYGSHIRYLNAAPTITLGLLSEDVRYQETGVYVCTANNGIVNSQRQIDQKGSGYVISKAPPFFLKRSQTVLGQKRHDVTIDVSIYSEPKFTGITWYKDGSPISPSSKYVMSNSNDIITTTFHGFNVQVDGYKLTLTIKSLQENDFTNYTVKIFNGVGGQVEHLVIFLSASPPDTPTNFNITSVVGPSVTVEWKPAFDGGHQQSFVVQYRASGAEEWQNASVPNSVGSSQGVLQRFTLTNLVGLTSYDIRMFAKNKFDTSSPTYIVVATTSQPKLHLIKFTFTQLLEQPDAQTFSLYVVAGVAGGLSSVILILIGVIVVLLWRLNVLKREKSKDKRNEIYETQHYMDVTEDSKRLPHIMHSPTDVHTTSPVSEYEELGMRDQPNVYSRVENAAVQRGRENHFYSNQ